MTKLEQVKEKALAEVGRYEWENSDLVKQYFSNLLTPNIIYSLNKDEKDIDPKSSRVGGMPVVPDDFEWPTLDYGKNAPLAFFFQINFAELKPYDEKNILPEKGILACFVGVTDGAMHNPSCPSARKTYFFKDIEELSPKEFPVDLPDAQKLEAHKIEYHISYEVTFGNGLFEKISELQESLGELDEDDQDGIWDVSTDILNEGIFKKWKFAETNEAMFSFYRISGSFDPNIAYKWAGEVKGKEEDCICFFEMRFDQAEGFGFEISDADLYLCLNKKDLHAGNLDKITMLIENS